jgi:hypothetical protein
LIRRWSIAEPLSIRRRTAAGLLLNFSIRSTSFLHHPIRAKCSGARVHFHAFCIVG